MFNNLAWNKIKKRLFNYQNGCWLTAFWLTNRLIIAALFLSSPMACNVHPILLVYHPTGHFRGHGHKPSTNTQNKCRLVGQIPMPLPLSLQGYRAGQAYCSMTKKHLYSLISEGWLTARLSSPAPWSRPSQDGWGTWSPRSWNTESGSPSKNHEYHVSATQ